MRTRSKENASAIPPFPLQMYMANTHPEYIFSAAINNVIISSSSSFGKEIEYENHTTKYTVVKIRILVV